MDQLHQSLLKSSRWYNFWHKHRLHKHTHWTVFISTGILITSLLVSQINFQSTPTFASATFNCDFYASPTGLDFGDGSLTNPWDILTAFHKGSGLSGKTLCLRGGTYNTLLESNLVGATVRSAPGEWAKIDSYVTTTLLTALPANIGGDNGGPCTFSTLGKGITIGDPGGTLLIGDESLLVFNPNGNSATCLRYTAPHAAGSNAFSLGSPFTVKGSDTIYRDFEIFNSNPQRVFNSTNGSGRRSSDIFVYGPRTKLVNMVIHDIQDGIFGAVSAIDAEFYGNIIYNNGVVDQVRGHGHGLYLQNDDVNHPKKMTDLISFNNFSTGMKGFGTHGPSAGMEFEGIMSFNNGSPAALPGNPVRGAENPNGYPINHREDNLFVGPGDQAANAISIKNNYTYHPDGVLGTNVGLGWSSVRNGSVVVQNNYFAGGSNTFALAYWSSATVTSNTIYGSKVVPESAAGQNMISAGLDTLTGVTWNNNTYFDGFKVYDNGKTYAAGLGLTGVPVANAFGGGLISYDETANSFGKGWKQWTGFDTNSTYTIGKPTQNAVFIRPNQYEQGRANIAVYNWQHLSNVNINLSQTGLQNGQQFKIVKAEDYFGTPVLTGTYSSSSPSVSLNMNNTTVTAPIGLGFTPTSTCPEFCVFVLLPVSTGSDIVPPPSISSFSASPASIAGGATASLSWSVSNATSLSIDNGVGAVTGTSRNVSPSQTTTYTLTAVGSGGSTSLSATVTVTAASSVPPASTPPRSSGGGGGGGGRNSSPSTPTPTVIPGCGSGNSFSPVTGQPCGASSTLTTQTFYNFGLVTLRNGSYGEAVKELQRYLNATLKLGLVIDGKFGPKTTLVMKKWQSDHGLVPDGLVGPKTKAMMNGTN